MQDTAKNTYASVQGRLTFVAFALVTILSMILIFLEGYNLANNNTSVDQIIIILSIFLGIMYSQIAMLIVEVVYQDEIHQLPLFSILPRLLPELSIRQRFFFLSMLVKRQIISLVFLTTTWIIVGGTHRAAAIIFTMTIITMLTLYGTHYMETLSKLYPDGVLPKSDGLTERIMESKN